jgi:hypothetical protein
MDRPNWLLRILRRIALGTPSALRPLLVAIAFGVGILMVQATVVFAYRIGGESRHLNGKLIAFLTTSAGIAALCYGLCREIVPPAIRARPWILGFAASAGLWLTVVLLSPSGIRSVKDVIALCVVIMIFGAFFGYLQLRSDREGRGDGA